MFKIEQFIFGFQYGASNPLNHGITISLFYFFYFISFNYL